MQFSHCEQPLGLCGNLVYSATYEIASVASLLRNDITTQSLRADDNVDGRLYLCKTIIM